MRSLTCSTLGVIDVERSEVGQPGAPPKSMAEASAEDAQADEYIGIARCPSAVGLCFLVFSLRSLASCLLAFGHFFVCHVLIVAVIAGSDSDGRWRWRWWWCYCYCCRHETLC